ncbi:hypothetical protein BDD12DRAFT_804880 [Trichophaea hybrida]|nr:hypothetical protein BDD12DRAFT_804880 [Trichophaea hybrida]
MASCIVILEDDYNDEMTKDDYVRDTVLNLLTSFASVRAQLKDEDEDYDSDDKTDYTIWNIAFDGTVDYGIELVCEQYSEHPNFRESCPGVFESDSTYGTVHYAEIKLISPIFTFVDSWKLYRDVKDVQRALSSSGLRNFITELARCHVHVNLGDNCLPFEVVKKIILPRKH